MKLRVRINGRMDVIVDVHVTPLAVLIVYFI